MTETTADVARLILAALNRTERAAGGEIYGWSTRLSAAETRETARRDRFLAEITDGAPAAAERQRIRQAAQVAGYKIFGRVYDPADVTIITQDAACVVCDAPWGTVHGPGCPHAGGQNPFACPNDPPCPHSGLIHDVYDLEDQVPRCCADGCDCGKRAGRQDRPLTREEYAAERRPA